MDTANWVLLLYSVPVYGWFVVTTRFNPDTIKFLLSIFLAVFVIDLLKKDLDVRACACARLAVQARRCVSRCERHAFACALTPASRLARRTPRTCSGGWRSSACPSWRLHS